MTTTIQKWGNSQGIRLPKHLLESVHWDENEELQIKAEDGKIIIEKLVPTKRKTIKELFDDFDEQYESIDIDWGNPVGEEIW